MRAQRSFVCTAVLLLCIGLAPLPAGAQLAGRSAAEWIKTLDSPARIASLRIDETISKLGLKPGDIVADIGAGSGIFEGPLSKAVPRGKVYAVDIDQALLDNIEKKKKEFQFANIETALGKFTDPSLPTKAVDLAFINDVLHHIEDRAGYLKSLAGYLKPTGRVAVIEFIPELSPHKNQPELQVGKDTTTAWMKAAGLRPLEEVRLFDDKWFVIYGR